MMGSFTLFLGIGGSGKHKKSRGGGMVGVALFVDRDRVGHRTAVKLSFARA